MSDGRPKYRVWDMGPSSGYKDNITDYRNDSLLGDENRIL